MGKALPSNPEVKNSGEWAVKERNKQHGSDLKLENIDGCWVIPMAEDYGSIYLFHLQALKGANLFKYQAFLWGKSTFNHPYTLLSFKEISPA